ncbi:MAG: hypothetical protein HXX20_06275 [Chloroflexi bacterium]|nr:hypothetical protein [Chloroflexota bacterium]
MISSPPPDSLKKEDSTFASGLFRTRLTGNVSLDDALEDTAVMAYEYERRWQHWWSKRRRVLIILLALPPLFLLLGVGLGLANIGLAPTLLGLALLSLLLLLLFLAYCWLTLPRISAFGRIYRRLVTVPLSHDGTVWCDAAVSAPDFPSLRDSFFALYRDSAATGARAQPDQTTEEQTEVNRKKWLLGDLSGMLAPLLDSDTDDSATPFIPGSRTGCLDRLKMEGLTESLAAELAQRSLPPNISPTQATIFARLAHEVEDYSNPEVLSGKVDLEKAIVGAKETPGQTPRQTLGPAPVYQQIATKVDENLGLVKAETERWEERTNQEQAFFAEQVSHLRQSQQSVEAAYEQVIAALEEEIRPSVQQLEQDVEFYQSQISRFYGGQREVIEGARDAALGKLDRELRELEGYQEERLDEQSLVQAEFKGLNDQRSRLENSTDNRFDTLKSQLAQLTGRSYSIPPPPVFRSNLMPDPNTALTTTEEVLQGLAELRAEARLSTNAVHSALNRYARLSFESLDDLGQLEQELSDGTKWQATRWLGNIINFRQSGQLLALAGEVSDSVGVYLDATGDFERLNARWCTLETAISQLGLASYANRLGEAQQYLVNLSDAIGSLHSSLAMAPHSPEMARPATFQSLYDLAAGLQRELEELGGLATNITRAEERLEQLEGELAELAEYIARNKSETTQVTEEAASRLTEVSRRQHLLEDKLVELRTERLELIRAHILEFHDQRITTLARLDAAAEDLTEMGETGDKILKKHLGRAERLLEEARKLREGLEGTIAAIVKDFERGVVSERTVLRTSELFVPVWFFQFCERPLWTRRMLGFASCYYSLNRVGSKTPEPLNLPSLVSFIFTQQPSTRYKLKEENDLANLVGAQNLDYPAGHIMLDPGTLERLAEEGWISPWLSKLLQRACQ